MNEQLAATPTSVLDETLATPFARIDDAALALLAATGWALEVHEVRRLSTERDDTVLVTHSRGRHVLKVAHPADDPELLDFQCAALAHAIDRDPRLPLPRLLPDVDGATLRRVTGADGEPRLARVLGYLGGTMLDYATTSTRQREVVGNLAGRLSLALSDFEHAASRRRLAWDLQQVGTLRPLLVHVTDDEVRPLVEAELDAYDDHVGADLRATRQQVVHHDLNADNLIVDHSAPGFVTGILDFGDAVRSSVVGDLAVAMSYALTGRDDDDPWEAAFDIARGFVSERALTPEETGLLPSLVRTRLAQRLLLNSWLAATNPSNAAYTGRSIARTAHTLRRLVVTPSSLGRPGA